MANIKVKDLTDTQTINTDNEIMVLTNENTNLVQNITVGNFITNVISSDSDNVIEQDTDGKLFVETPVNITGNLSNLTTTNKSTLVGAINEVDGDVGNLANLTTSVKTNVVNAINSEVSARNTAETNMQNDYNGKIGTLSNLDTTDKSNIVGAINELAAIAEPSLQYETMNNSKALETGAPSENAIILADIQKYAHSTFDSSKFTVVGTPNVTEDGIASGFSVNDYLTIDTSSVDWRKPYKIKIKCKLTSSIDSLGTLTYGNMPIIRNRSGKFQFSPASDYDHLSTVGDIEDSASISLNTDYVLLVEFDGTNYSFSKSIDDGQTYTLIGTKTTSQITTDLTTGGTSQVGNSLTYQPTRVWQGSIDLKQFSITVDGVPAFSGNKTDIDTIKPDDYTNTGTLGTDYTISADGIYQALTDNDRLTVDVPNTTTGLRIQFPVKVTQAMMTQLSSNQTVWLARYNKTGTGMNPDTFNIIYYDEYGSIALGAKNNASPSIVISDGKVMPRKLQLGDELLFDLQFNNTEIACAFNLNSGEYEYTLRITSNDGFIGLDGVLGFFNPTYPNYGAIDLNKIKAWLNGDLVYQSCLKIPYTEAHSGAKIANAIYRDRVTDAYNQGYVDYHYYTLSDTDFTLPIGDIYGMIENKFDTATATSDQRQAIIGYLMPDYASGISFSGNSSYTCPSYGVIICEGENANGYRHVCCNGAVVGAYSNTTNITTSCYFRVKKGNIITNIENTTFFGSAKFYPLKGV